MKTAFVTGGCGFIGSHLIDQLLAQGYKVYNFDKQTYAALTIQQHERLHNVLGIDVCDSVMLGVWLQEAKPNVVFHLAAETHVDRSIEAPSGFVQTNVVGTASLLSCLQQLRELRSLPEDFRLVHVSTDEVFGPSRRKLSEEAVYRPSSPYSASKASADHLVRSFGRTYGLPYVIAFPSNVFGPRQAEEKLIPKVIVSALRGDKIPLYGSGNQTRQWSYVVSTAKNLIALAELADVEESYHLPHCEDLSNLELISHILAALKECGYNRSLSDLLKRVDDRRGHDFGYNSDYTKFHLTIPYEKMHFGSLEEWLTPTVAWYVSRYGEHAKKDL